MYVSVYGVTNVWYRSAGRSCDCYYYVRYQTISIIGYPNYSWAWWWHWLRAYCLYSWIVIRYGFIHPEAYYPICYSQMSHAHTTPTTSRSRLGKSVGYFLRVRVSASSGLICIFVWNLTFQFRHIVVIFLLSTFLVVACACVCVCVCLYMSMCVYCSL